MPLSNMKNMLVEATGRYDLVDPGTYIGATWLLNAGQRMLDKMLSDGKSAARYYADTVAGTVLVPLPKCRVVSAVYLVTSLERFPLTKKRITWMRDEYADKTSLTTQSEPAYWSPCNVRPYPGELDSASFTNSWAFDDMIQYGHEHFNAIVIMPPPDAIYTLEVWGLFFSDVLVNNNDETYWTEEHPEILLKAALYQLETLYRNTEGAKDWMEAVKVDIDGLVKDIVEQEGINEMEEI